MTCCAQVFGIIPANNLGAHDSDWEHVTVRLTPDAKHVMGIYYSAHRRVLPRLLFSLPPLGVQQCNNQLRAAPSALLPVAKCSHTGHMFRERSIQALQQRLPSCLGTWTACGGRPTTCRARQTGGQSRTWPSTGTAATRSPAASSAFSAPSTTTPALEVRLLEAYVRRGVPMLLVSERLSPSAATS